MNLEIIEKLKTLTSSVLIDERMQHHTTFKVGGPADVFITPTIRELPGIIEYLETEQVPYFIFGNGSNLLVSDEGVRGVVIELGKNASGIKSFPHYEKDIHRIGIEAEAGALLSQVARTALNHGMKGFEFAAGIPGTIGGAVTMNAGAYGGEMKDVLIEAKVYDKKEKEVKLLSVEELELGYRRSIISNGDYVVLSARMLLDKGEVSEIQAVMDDLRNRRVSKQPLEFASAGSTFKRPEGYFAGKLIEDAGLKGYTVGGAQVSEKHAGFVINTGYATAADVYKVISDVRNIVLEKFGVELEPEVKMIGEFGEN